LEKTALFKRVVKWVCVYGVLATTATAQTPQSAPKPAPAIAGPTLLFDAQTGEVLAQERAGETWYPASVTKLMTAYIVFQKLRAGTMRLDQDIYVSARASAQEPSKIGVPSGKTVTVDFALQALLVHSANDMAYVLAEAASGSVERFAAEMNAVAKNLGLSATHYENPNGLFNPRQVTSARDMGVLAAVMINEFPQHAHYYEQDNVAVGKRRLPNRNSLIRIMPDADGMKTGFVCNSGYNLVASATRNGRKLVAVIMGARSGGNRAAKAQQMLEQGFATPPNPSASKVGEILNLPQGAIVPADMTTTVCKRKAPVALADGSDLAGWAVSFGTYDTMQKADMALRGRVLSPVGIDANGYAGIVKLPNKAGFAAMLWGLSQPESLTLCAGYRTDNAHCDVMPPALVDQIATYVKSIQPKVKEVAQGSESDSDEELGPAAREPGPMVKPKTKKQKKRVQKTIPIKKKKK
jgi:D-alanyl-D-alanine carboxypeptidase